ncbi:hypothetical protein TELCIR_15351 [Teladorsagia circumcincta]|uniref:TIL domain-containing protein n=1 Tax=Teladorsagia circumcincta TaxID=45464 RepID=A0A2G9TYP0_TELCI|nr:hypothetical protein TELCIR_15351 [Teladorsagia circumcincta]
MLRKFTAPSYTFSNEAESKRDKKCSKNEEFMSCGTKCEPTCNVATSPCTGDCVQSGCQCKNGYKRGENGCRLPGPDCE